MRTEEEFMSKSEFDLLIEILGKNISAQMLLLEQLRKMALELKS